MKLLAVSLLLSVSVLAQRPARPSAARPNAARQNATLPKVAPSVLQAGPIQAGPMVGYADMREVALWVQTRQPATVQILYKQDSVGSIPYVTAPVQTEAHTAYTATLIADAVEPGKRYVYDVLVNGKPVPLRYPTRFQTQPLWQWRTDPPAFSFAVGSCTYVNEPPFDRPGKPYGGGYEIFGAMAARKPDFMLWTGDNTYTREVDWNSRTGVLKRYTHTRALPEMQPLLGATSNYAIWDDHDYGPNDSDRGYWLKPVTLEAFKLFWPNPNYIFNEGCTGTFVWGDCQFFLMDDRTFRAPNDAPDGPDKAYYGEKQLQWLVDALTTSNATFKFVVTGGQIINPTKAFETYSNYGHERDRFLQTLAERKIPGVVFLTGDRHHSIVHKLERSGTYPLYDVTISPLTSGPAKPRADELEQPTYVAGTAVSDRNFATLSVAGPLKDRSLTIRVFDQKGEERWTRILRAADLR